MFEDRSLKLDLCALALLALVAFLGVALWTYNPTDPPSTLVWPARASVENACGRTGALAAHFLLESLGIGAYAPYSPQARYSPTGPQRYSLVDSDENTQLFFAAGFAVRLNRFSFGATLWEDGYGFPFMGSTAQFLFKDAVLLAGCLALTLHAGHALREERRVLPTA